jgi:hypothetical protein
MARVKDQEIPVELATLYATTLGPTRAVSYPGEQHAGLNDQVESHYPSSIEPPHVPTVKQLRQREYFSIAFKCFNEATPNERTAYWRLSKAGPIPYYNDYMRKNIPLAIEGFTCPFWAAPNARSFMSLMGNTWGTYEMHLSDIEQHFLSLVLELDPINVGPPDPPWPIIEEPYSLLHLWFDWPNNKWVIDELMTWDPDARSEYEFDVEIPEVPSGPYLCRYIYFCRYGHTEEGEAVVWYTEIDDPMVSLTYTNFE